MINLAENAAWQEMAVAVAKALKKTEHLIVEAGTGVGKRLGYLVPAILFAVEQKKKAVVCTHTINLQEQLTEKDLPMLTKDPDIAHVGEYNAALGDGSHVHIVWTDSRAPANGVTLGRYREDPSDPTSPETGATAVISPILVIDANHVVYVVWFEYRNSFDYLKIRSVTSHGASLGTVRTIRQLATTDFNANLHLARTNNSNFADDTFRAVAFPVVAANPSSGKAGHLYVAYADKGSGLDKSRYLFHVFNGWRRQLDECAGLNTDSAANDQWMPVICAKPDGTKLFVAWYDRRNDLGNSMIDVYGRWGTVATDGTLSFGNDFRVSTGSFPPVFAGTLPDKAIDGHYDPVYPPGGINLHWWWTSWPAPAVNPEYEGNPTADTYARHVGEYNGVWSNDSHVHVVWTDSRLPSTGTAMGTYREDPSDPTSPESNREVPLIGRQRDIRHGRLSWPEN